MQLNIILLNCQDLYIFMDKYKGEDLDTITPPKWQLLSTSFFPNKNLEKVNQLSKFFLHHKADILMLTEVGGKESLENFNKFFLQDKYKVLLEPSNSDRGIDLGYLVKKDLEVETQLISHTKAKLENGKKFARGVFELRLIKNNKPIFINLLTHLKSKLDLKKQDFEGRTQRVSEVKYLAKLHKKLSNDFPNIPVFISGDLNAIIYKDQTEPELSELLTKGHLLDIFEIDDRPFEKRVTYCYFDKKRDRFDMQLDYILVPKKYKSVVDTTQSQVLSFFSDRSIEYPDSLSAKLALPSDHYPVQCKINL